MTGLDTDLSAQNAAVKDYYTILFSSFHLFFLQTAEVPRLDLSGASH